MTTRILIIDPDIAFTVPIKHAVEQVGDYVVNVFASGQAAVEQIQRETFDVVILDLGISDMHLSELIHALRKARPGLPILVTTGPGVDTEAYERALSSLDVQGNIIAK